MKGLVINIEEKTRSNDKFREVLFTTKNSQLVVMSLLPGQDIGAEVHHLDQFIKVEAGNGASVLNGEHRHLETGYAVVIPAGTEHNIINTSTSDTLKLYTVYSPPNHKDGTIHNTKEDATRDEDEHFDGVTTQ